MTVLTERSPMERSTPPTPGELHHKALNLLKRHGVRQPLPSGNTRINLNLPITYSLKDKKPDLRITFGSILHADHFIYADNIEVLIVAKHTRVLGDTEHAITEEQTVSIGNNAWRNELEIRQHTVTTSDTLNTGPRHGSNSKAEPQQLEKIGDLIDYVDDYCTQLKRVGTAKP